MAEGSREGAGDGKGIHINKANCEHQKGEDLVSKNNITLHLHHTIWYISLPSLYADYT